jgi:hypothetical protein
MADEAQSGYYQAIAREFLRRRGAPFFLSPLDLGIIAGWEKKGVPLQVVLEGIGRAFDGLRDRSRGTKGLSLSFCDAQVQKALAQHADRRAGRRKLAAPRSEKVIRARKETESCLRSLPAGDGELRSLYETASRLLAESSPDEETLEKIDSGVDEILWSRVSRPEREELRRRMAKESPGADPAETAAAVRTRLVRASRQKHKISYVSLFYY